MQDDPAEPIDDVVRLCRSFPKGLKLNVLVGLDAQDKKWVLKGGKTRGFDNEPVTNLIHHAAPKPLVDKSKSIRSVLQLKRISLIEDDIQAVFTGTARKRLGVVRVEKRGSKYPSSDAASGSATKTFSCRLDRKSDGISSSAIVAQSLKKPTATARWASFF
jgi:hypothetical protein